MKGRLTRIHLDRFFNYWVVMQIGRDVNADSVSTEFNTFLSTSDSPIQEIARAIRNAGQVYQDLEEARLPGIEAFLRRMKTMEIGVVMPLLPVALHDSDSRRRTKEKCSSLRKLPGSAVPLRC